MQRDTAPANPYSAPSVSGTQTAGVGEVSLRAELGLFSAWMLVIGAVIGSGIFFKPMQIAQATGGHLGLILSLWLACGLVNLCGALTLAELTAMMPHAGGTYVFLREAYGRLVGYLWAWAEFWVIRSGAIASLAAALGMTLVGVLKGTAWAVSKEAQPLLEVGVAAVAIGGLSLVNVLGVRHGGRIQNLTTVIKIGFVGFLALLPFLATAHTEGDAVALWPAEWNAGLWSGIGAALAAIMWAYDGWGNITVVAEEIRRPQRNIPWALGGGVLVVTLIYVGAVWGYHRLLPLATIQSSNNAAEPVMRGLLGDAGPKLLSAMLLVSIFGALNSNILVGPRVLFALARDHHRLRGLARLDPRTATPVAAIVGLAVWSALLVGVSYAWKPMEKRLFDTLTDYCVFGGSLFYLGAVAAVFVLRIRRPDAPRPYRTWGYPVVPLLFVAFYLFLLWGMLISSPASSLAALALVCFGLASFPFVGRAPAGEPR